MNEYTNRQKQLINILKRDDCFHTADQLAKDLNVSVRTIKTEIKSINSLSKQTGMCISSKPRAGYKVTSVTGNVTDNTLKTGMHSSDFPITIQDRIEYVTRKLLVIDYHIKKDELADELAISINSISQILIGVRARIERFSLKLVSRSNYGVIIEGSEVDKRLAISEFFFHEYGENGITEKMRSFSDNDENEKLLNLIKKACTQFHIEMSELSLKNMAIHISIMMKRSQFYDYVVPSDEDIDQIRNSVEFKAASEIIRAIEKKKHYLLPIGEIVYTAQHIRCKRVSSSEKNSIAADSNLKTCLKIMFSEINNNFGLNLKDDDDLYQYLYQHIPPMVMRLKSHMTIRNPLVIESKRKYLFATKVTHSACKMLEQYYHVHVDDNEFGYLLLYFNLAIMKFEANKHITIGILTAGERSEMLMYSNEIRDHFSSAKYNVIDIEGKTCAIEPDIYVSLRKIDNSTLSPLYIIEDDDYLRGIDELIGDIRYSIDLGQYVKPEYCCFNLPGDTKDMVLQQYYKMLVKHKVIKKYPASYEHLEYDELGNGIVHFQDTSRIVHDNLCFITVLQKQVYWDRGSVRVLVFTKTKKDNDKELYNLCRLVSKWANSRSSIDKVIRKQTFESFYSEIIKGETA